MTDYLTTRVQGKRTEGDRTFFLLQTLDGKVKGIEYNVPFQLLTMHTGSRINFYQGSITDGTKGMSIHHERYVSADFYEEGGSPNPLLRISGKGIALYERAIQADKERVATDAANERTVIGAADGREVIE